jgi:acetylornithine deacetylase/succinyl-diaminopimelate desuccinylase-like protein
MNETDQRLIELVDPDCLRDLTLDLVRIPSPTGDCAAVAEYYAQVLRDIGLDVELDYPDEYPQSPNVIARLRGAALGRTLQFDGHLDTIHAPHDPPCYRDGRIYGRGATDMKSSLAAVAEVVRVIKESGVKLRGDVLITAHGMHEAPWGIGETLRLLINKGHVGDAAFVMEGNPGELPVIGKGLSIFEVDIHREGDAIHETAATNDLPHPIVVGHQLVQAMLDKNAEFARTDLPYDMGPETYFIGIFESGDFYNRVPTHCRIVGTRRYAPNRSFNEVEAEFRGMTTRIAVETGAGIDVNIWRQRDGFEIDPGIPIAVALREAYATVYGEPIKLIGLKICGDSSIFIHEAGIPALLYGPGLTRAHADVEWVELQDVVATTKVFLISALNYLGVAA